VGGALVPDGGYSPKNDGLNTELGMEPVFVLTAPVTLTVLTPLGTG
jgi:hypothetical protein